MCAIFSLLPYKDTMYVLQLPSLILTLSVRLQYDTVVQS